MKEAEHQIIDAFELWCWRRLLRVPWTARRSNQSVLKEISPEYSLEELMLKLKLQYFGHLMRRANSLEKAVVLGKTGIPWWLRQWRICLQCRRREFDLWLGRSPGEGNGNPLQYPCLENPMEGEAWWATVHGATRSQTRLSGFTSLHLFRLHWVFSSWVILYCLFECLIFLMDTKYYKFCFAEYWILYILINNPELYFGVQLGYLESVWRCRHMPLSPVRQGLSSMYFRINTSYYRGNTLLSTLCDVPLTTDLFSLTPDGGNW